MCVHTDRQTDGHTDRQKNRQTDRQASFDSLSDPNEEYRDAVGRKRKECDLLRNRESEGKVK